jgi:hypothetical protein
LVIASRLTTSLVTLHVSLRRPVSRVPPSERLGVV